MGNMSLLEGLWCPLFHMCGIVNQATCWAPTTSVVLENKARITIVKGGEHDSYRWC